MVQATNTITVCCWLSTVTHTIKLYKRFIVLFVINVIQVDFN